MQNEYTSKGNSNALIIRMYKTSCGTSKKLNNALMILCVALGIQEGLLGKNTKWYKEKWNRETVTENDECKLSWDFEYHLCKTIKARQPGVTIEYKNKNKIFLIDMACPSENNVDAKHAEKLQKYH